MYSQNNYKVTVCGASGGIGQPLSLLLKQNALVTELSLYDIVHTPGVAADLSHIDTQSKTEGFMGAEQMGNALKGKLLHRLDFRPWYELLPCIFL